MFKPRRRPQLSQTFLHNRKLVKELVRRSSIDVQDLVLEIGPGKGIITRELLGVAGHVIAIELDHRLYQFLKQRFDRADKLTLFRADVLHLRLPLVSYKVFANIPFSIEGELVRKFINSHNPPDDCYLVMRKSVADRLGGIYQDGLFSITHKPWFEFEIFHRFQPRDFTPTPLVHPVMMRITRRETPLLPSQEQRAYTAFVRCTFGGGRRLQHNLRPFFRPEQLNRLARRYHFWVNSKPSDLTIHQWIVLFSESRNRGQKGGCFSG